MSKELKNPNLFQKLIKIRKSVPYLKKDNQGHQYKYVSSSQALGSLRGKMDELGVLLLVEILNSKVRESQTARGNRQYMTELKLRYTWVDADNPQDRITCEFYGQGIDEGEKGVGKALTYAEKYLLLKTFNIATDKDDPDAFQERVAGESPSGHHDQETDTRSKSGEVTGTHYLVENDNNQGKSSNIRYEILATEAQLGFLKKLASDSALPETWRKRIEEIVHTGHLTKRQATSIISAAKASLVRARKISRESPSEAQIQGEDEAPSKHSSAK